MPKNLNSITIIIPLEGIKKIKTEKMTAKQSHEILALKNAIMFDKVIIIRV